VLNSVVVAADIAMSLYDSIRGDIAEFLAKNYALTLDAIAPESTLEDLGFDSLGLLGVATLLENKHRLKLESTSIMGVRTVGDLLALVKSKSAEQR
jgi:acyl carrier protein